MHYAVIIPVRTKESAEAILVAVLDSGIEAFIEERNKEEMWFK